METPDFSDKSMAKVIAPGPAIRGIASGKVAREDSYSTSIASSIVSSLLFCL